MRRYLLGLILAIVCAPAAQADQRYVTPTGTGTTCSQASPCGIATGIGSAASVADVVNIAPGTYGSPQAPVGTLQDSASITVTGNQTGPGRAVVYGSLALDSPSSQVFDLHFITSSGRALDLRNGASAQEVIGESSGGSGCFIQGGGSIKNSLCTSTQSGGSGLEADVDANTVTAPLIRYVTATGACVGIYTHSYSNAGPTIEASVARGQLPCTADISFSNRVKLSDVYYETSTGGAPQSNQNPVTSGISLGADSTQNAGSATIDAAPDVAGTVTDGDTDLNGNPRKVGGTLDIGAFERPVQGPAATAGDATAITRTTATIPANVTPNQATLTYYVTYGTGGSCTGATSNKQYRAYFAPASNVTVPLTGLAPDTTYTYCVVAHTDGGDVTTASKTFETQRSAPTATAAAATDVTDTTATLHGAVDIPPGVTAHVHFELTPDGGTTSTVGAQDVTTDGAITGSATGLLPKHGYTYEVVVDDVGNGGGGATSGDSTFNSKPTPPAATADSVSDITPTSATLHGGVTLHGESGQARFVYGPSLTDPQTVTTDGPVTSALTGLDPNTTYEWKARVTTADWIRESDVMTFKTLPLAPTATTGDATNVTTTGAHLEGTADTQGVQGQVGFVLDGTTVGEVTRATGPYSFDVTGLAPGSTHTYRLRVVTTGGSALGDEGTFTTTAATASPTPTPTAAPTTKGAIKIGVVNAKVKDQLSLKRKSVTAKIKCTGFSCTLKVSAIVKAGKKMLGKLKPGRGKLQAGREGRIALAIPSKLRKRLPKNAKITITATVTGADGTTVRKSLTFRVRRPAH